jgi:hypothetical protein
MHAHFLGSFPHAFTVQRTPFYRRYPRHKEKSQVRKGSKGSKKHQKGLVRY